MKSLGKIIDSVRLGEDDALHFEFLDCDTLKIGDDGQSCCERRYMTTDDNLQDYVGATFLGIELKEAPNIEDEYGKHEVLFLEIKTSKGCFTMATHNEHNGYYSGFSIRMTENE